MKGQAIPRVKAHNHFGLKVTSTLSWSEHISRRHACEMHRASGYDQEDSSSSPEPRFNKDLCSSSSFCYGIRCVIWRGDNISVLQKLQDRFCRENQVKLPPVQARPNHLALLLVYKIKNKLSHPCLQCLPPQACSMSSQYHLHRHNFPVPTVMSSRALKAFLPRSILLWNDLPPDIQALRTVTSFKAALKNVVSNDERSQR